MSSIAHNVVMQADGLARHYAVSQGFLKPKLTVKALNGVSFTLQAGKTLAVVGESKAPWHASSPW
jgi:dipeptide transport system ATP-binding protein